MSAKSFNNQYTTMPYLKIPVVRTCSTFVIVAIPPDRSPADITPEIIEQAVERTTGPEEWDTVKIRSLKPQPMPAEEAEEYLFYEPWKPAPTMAERAAEIGVSRDTLQRWKREGIDIFDDEQVRDKVALARSYNPSISPRFRRELGE